MELPLTTGTRVFFGILTGLAAIAIPLCWSQGMWALPGGVTIVAVAALLVDGVRRSSGIGRIADPTARVQGENRGTATAIWWCAGIAAACAVVGTVAFETAVYRTVIDTPEVAETFREERYFTGEYNVERTSENLCWVGQDWYECMNRRGDAYNQNCANVRLTILSDLTCKSYLKMLNGMESLSLPGGSVVTDAGSAGGLSRREHWSSRRVSNNDYEPAETHEAVCYLGFIGECVE